MVTWSCLLAIASCAGDVPGMCRFVRIAIIHPHSSRGDTESFILCMTNGDAMCSMQGVSQVGFSPQPASVTRAGLRSWQGTTGKDFCRAPGPQPRSAEF